MFQVDPNQAFIGSLMAAMFNPRRLVVVSRVFLAVGSTLKMEVELELEHLPGHPIVFLAKVSETRMKSSLLQKWSLDLFIEEM